MKTRAYSEPPAEPRYALHITDLTESERTILVKVFGANIRIPDLLLRDRDLDPQVYSETQKLMGRLHAVLTHVTDGDDHDDEG